MNSQKNYNELSDNELVKEVKDNACSDSLLELSKRHSKLCFSVYNQYQNGITAAGKNFEDVVRDKDLMIWKSCLSFDLNKGSKFSTWLANQVTYQCLTEVSRNRNNNLSLEDEEAQVFLSNQTGTYDQNPHLKDYFTHILTSLKDTRIHKIYDMRYFDGEFRSWDSIGKEMKLSIETVIKLHDKGLDFLKRKLTSPTITDIT